MTIFNVLSFIGGISIFLLGMNLMGKSLEKRAGDKLKGVINKLTSNKFTGFLTGLLVTAIIQSSSATTVMVVGFVNSGLMSLSQAVGVIMGANIGTTVTSWILSLTGLSGSNIFVQLLKPSSFSPILALIGIILYMFFKDDKKKDTGMILLGFAVLMFGMETMSSSVSGLKNVESFRNLFVAFENPLLGILVGAGVTAIIQSSSASIGILQAFATTGQIKYGACVPIILGQNIGTCVTALISSIGTNKNAKRASLVHLFFNLIGTAIFITLYLIVKAVFKPLILDESASLVGIAIIHTGFNVFCTLMMLPASKLLEKLVCLIVPDSKDNKVAELDERLFVTPSIALGTVKSKIMEMAEATRTALTLSIEGLFSSEDKFNEIHKYEDRTDELEDIIGTYLVKLSAKELDIKESRTSGEYLKVIGDLERIADHALNLAKLEKEIREKDIHFSSKAQEELHKITKAVLDVWDITAQALDQYDINLAKHVEPLEQVIDKLNEIIRNRHIERLQKDECNINVGFVWADILSNLERISDHCSNIAGCIIDDAQKDMNMHININEYKHNNEEFNELYDEYSQKYLLGI